MKSAHHSKSKVNLKDMFRKFARTTSDMAGTPAIFIFALLGIVAWLISGPFFSYSDTWQLVINTTTTIITFLMVFLIQNAQNRDARAIHLKLDELVKALKGARNEFIDLENLTDEELELKQKEFKQLHDKFSSHLSQRRNQE